MAGVGPNTKNQFPKWMDWKFTITVFHTMKNIVDSIKSNQETVENECCPRPLRSSSSCIWVCQREQWPRWYKNISRIFIWHIVKMIRRSIIFSNTCKTHVWKCWRACVYIFCPYCDFFRAQEGKGASLILYFLHLCYYWMKKIKRFNNCVEIIERLQFNLSLITLAICTSWCCIWNNVILWSPLTTTSKLVIWVIQKIMYNISII